MLDQDKVFESLNLRREYLHEQIAASIQNMIAEDDLESGSRLPSERQLAQTLGVNRATVREAIRLLQERGLVEIRIGNGTYVTDMTPAVVSESIARYFFCGSCAHEDLFVLREILEPEMAALAAVNASPDELAKLSELVNDIESTFSRQDLDNYVAADTGFHEMLAVATHNELIAAIVAGLEEVMKKWIRAQTELYRLEAGALSHRGVYEGIVARDPDRAREAMRIHMRTARSALFNANKAPTQTDEEAEG